MQIIYSPQFQRSFRKLPQQLQVEAWELLELFKINPFNPKLRTHKLSHTQTYSFSVTYKIRILFVREQDIFILLNIGDHSVYRK